ncbi:MAG: DUF63 family protein [Candidatus Anstonellaceae archaeon]
MEDFIQEYFLNPIADRSGYNLVNTLTYAAIALALLYVIWRVLKKRVDFSSSDFLLSLAAFVLFGSTCRVVTDLADSGALAEAAAQGGVAGRIFQAAQGIFSYGYLTVTPGIYVVTALVFFASLWSARLLGNVRLAAYFGAAIWAACLLLVLPFAKYWEYFALAILVAAASAAGVFWLFKRKLMLQEKLAIAGQALDGATTFVVIDIFAEHTGKRYFEQHVLSAVIGTATPFGFLLFLAVKVLLAALVVHALHKEAIDSNEKAFVLAVVAVIGFAPGIRDGLRMLAGT